MAWDFQTLYGEIQDEVEDDGEDLSVIKQFINDVCRKIWHAEPWRFREFKDTFPTVAGSRTYSLTSVLGYPVLQITRVSYKGENETQFVPLTERNQEYFDNYYTDLITQNRPEAYLPNADNLELHPTPDYSGGIIENVQVRGEKRFVELTADADVPLIPEDYKHVIKAGVKQMYYDFDDDTRAEVERVKFEGVNGMGGGLAEMRSAELDSSTQPHQGSIASHKF